jgi:hypothetical protein
MSREKMQGVDVPGHTAKICLLAGTHHIGGCILKFIFHLCYG